MPYFSVLVNERGLRYDLARYLILIALVVLIGIVAMDTTTSSTSLCLAHFSRA